MVEQTVGSFSMCAKSQMYVLLEVGAPLSLVDAELDRVGDYDCLVDVLYTSVCGTQVGEIRVRADRINSFHTVWVTKVLE